MFASLPHGHAGMIEQQGRVVRTGEARAWVLLGPASGCAACAAGQGCGAGLLGRLLRREPVELSLPDPGGLRVGQAVLVGVGESAFLGMVMHVYGWPLLAGLALGAVCHHIAGLYDLGRAWTDLATLGGLLGGAWASLARRRGASERRLLSGGATVLRAVEARSCEGRAARNDAGME